MCIRDRNQAVITGVSFNREIVTFVGHAQLSIRRVTEVDETYSQVRLATNPDHRYGSATVDFRKPLGECTLKL